MMTPTAKRAQPDLQRGGCRGRAGAAPGAPCVWSRRSRPWRARAGDAHPVLALPATEERAGWASVGSGRPPPGRPPDRPVFRRVRPSGPTRSSMTRLWSRQRGPFVCVFNRTGRPASWPAAIAASWPGAPAAAPPRSSQSDREVLACPRCDENPPGGVRRLRTPAYEDAAGRGEPAARGAGGAAADRSGRGRGTRDRPDVPTAPVLIGTEAVLHRVRRASAVVFLDVDLHLLASRLSAPPTRPWPCLIRPSRLVGARHSALPRPGSWSRHGRRTIRCSRRLLGRPGSGVGRRGGDPPGRGLPPFRIGRLSGPGARPTPSFGQPPGPRRLGLGLADGRRLLRAPDTQPC